MQMSKGAFPAPLAMPLISRFAGPSWPRSLESHDSSNKGIVLLDLDVTTGDSWPFRSAVGQQSAGRTIGRMVVSGSMGL